MSNRTAAEREREASTHEVAFHIDHDHADGDSRNRAPSTSTLPITQTQQTTTTTTTTVPATAVHTTAPPMPVRTPTSSNASALRQQERDIAAQKAALYSSSTPLGTKEERTYGSGLEKEQVRPAGTMGQPIAGYADDAAYGSAYQRAKIDGGGTGYYDEKEHKYHEELPKQSLGERLLQGVTRPTNLTAGERPHKGKTSTGVDNFDQVSYEKVSTLPDRGWSHWPHFLSFPLAWYPWNVNMNAYRLGMIPILALCLMGCDQRHHRWMYYVTVGLACDYAARMLFGPRASLCTLFGEVLDSIFQLCRSRRAEPVPANGQQGARSAGIFPRSFGAGAPYQFSDFCGMCIFAAAAICFFTSNDDDGDTAGAVILAFMALVSALELFLGFPMFVWFFNQMIHFGWIWKDCEIKSAMIRDERQRFDQREGLRLQAAEQQLASGPDSAAYPSHIHYSSTGRHRSLPFSYRTAHEYHKKHEYNPIRYCKVSYFLVPLSMTALAWIWLLSSYIFNTPRIIWQALVIAAFVVYGITFLLYAGKVMFYSRNCMYEHEHPLYRSLFLTIPLTWLLFIPMIIEAGYPTLAEVAFWMSAPILLFMSCQQLSYYFHQSHFWENFNASWMLLPLANALCAYMLPLVHSSYAEAAWLWLGIACFMFMILSTLLVLKGTMFPRVHDIYRYYMFTMFATAFAICIAAVVIYQPAGAGLVAGGYTNTNSGTTTTGATHTPLTTGSSTSAAITPNKYYDVTQSSTAADNFINLPTAGSNTNDFINFYSSNIQYNLVPQATQRINTLPAGQQYLVASNFNGAQCQAMTDGSGWNCQSGAAADQTQTTTTGGFVSTWPLLSVATFYIGLVLFLTCFFLSLQGYFFRSSYNQSYWACAISMCIMTVACLYYHATWRSKTTEGITITAMVITNIAVAVLFLNQLRKFITFKLFRPDHMMLSPTEFFRLPNKALREALGHLQAHVQNPQATVEEWKLFEEVYLPQYVLTSYAFNYLRRHTLYPVMAAWFGAKLLVPIDQRAHELDHEISNIHERLVLAQQLPINSSERALEEQAIRKDFSLWVTQVNAQLDEEEVHVYSLARRYISAKEANGLVRKCWDDISPSQWSIIIPFVLQNLHCDRERIRFIECLITASPEHTQLLGKFCYENLDPFLFERMVVDIPEMRPRLTPGYTRMW